MKITQYGTVTLTTGDPHIEGWRFEREPDVDPADATNEELLLGFAVCWAQERFNAALQSAQMDVFRKMVKAKLDKSLPLPETN